MKVQEITRRKALEVVKHDTATAIRKLLDEQVKQWPEDERDDVEREIIELVTGED
jgi:DNA-binding ferritin-like protein (Dps family)